MIDWRAIGLAAVILIASAAPAPAQPADSIAGQLLVATEDMPDARFAETVILMVRHNRDGAMGLIVNRPAGELSLSALMEEMGMLRDPADGGMTAHYGGPVELRRAFALHSTDVLDPSSTIVNAEVAMTSGRSLVAHIADGDAPAEYLFIMGYAGWSPGQLESELQQPGWAVIPYAHELVFTDTPEDTWARAIARVGVDL